MKSIAVLCRVNPKYISNNLYGVEIEVEGENLPTPDQVPPVWRVERDSSLKTAEAWEYVLRAPLMLDGVREALTSLDNVYKKRKSVVHDSVRAGVHVHMNVQDWNIKQVMTFSTAYYILEDILLRWCGENREGNLFCLRTRDAEYVLFKILNALKERNLKHLQSDIIRYSSLNYCSLFKYGTIEFRGMRGTPDLSLIYKWNEVLDELRTSSLNFSNPRDVLDQLSGDGEDAFLQTLLPNNYHLFQYAGADKVIRNSARRVQMIAFGVDWDTLSAPQINPFIVDEGSL